MPKNKIHKLSDGRYTYSATDCTGKRHRLNSLQGEKKSSFIKRCDELDKQIERFKTSQDITLNDLFYKWVADTWEDAKQNLENKKDFKLADYDTITAIYKNHIEHVLGNRPLPSIRKAEIYELLMNLREQGYSDSLINKAKGAISRPINWSIQTLGYDIPNVANHIRLPARINKKSENIRVFTKEDEERFFEAAKTSKWFNYFKILLLTGFRPSEAFGLRWEDVGQDSIILRQSITIRGLGNLKTPSAYRSFPITPKIRLVLENQKSQYPDMEWVFAGSLESKTLNAPKSAFHRIIKRTAIWEKVDRKYHGILIKEPLDYTMYDFRHTFGTRCAEAGVPDYVLAKLMGHSDISITKKYYISVTDRMITDAKNLLEDVFN